MKKKIGEIYNKPIVIGNKNEITKNEVHIDNLGGSTSGEGGGSASTMEYFRAESIKELGLQNWASSLKWNNEGAGSITIAPATKFTFDDFDNSALIAVGIDFQSEYRMPEPFNGKLIDVLLKMGIPQAVLDAIPRITKEEFYNLEVPVIPV
jgi:hypothetical protein